VHVHNPRKIERKYGGVVVSEPEIRDYKLLFLKRRPVDNFEPQPYGYEDLVVVGNLLLLYDSWSAGIIFVTLCLNILFGVIMKTHIASFEKRTIS